MSLKPPDATHDYIGINEHGECVAICVDDPAWKKDTARTIADWIKRGYTIQHLPHAEACARMKADHPKWKARRAAEAEAKLI